MMPTNEELVRELYAAAEGSGTFKLARALRESRARYFNHRRR
jgi:hypothetical protein